MKRLSLLVGLCLAGIRIVQAATPPCAMRPAHRVFRLPETSLRWAEGEESEGRCDEIEAAKWIRRPSRAGDVLIFPDGPEGSGLYWRVTFGIANESDAKPHRGVCLSTSTVGARTLSGQARRALRFFKGAPFNIVTALPWVEDLNADGQTEILIWDSFPLVGDPEVYQFGLVAWVYQVQPTGVVEIDWTLSRRVAREIAAGYRTSLKNEPAPMRRVEGRLWQAAANRLDAFANNRCTPAPDVAR